MNNENASEEPEKHSILLSVEELIFVIGSHKKPTVALRCFFSMSRLGNRTRIINCKGEDLYDIPVSIELVCDSRQLEVQKEKKELGYIFYWEPMDSGDGVVKSDENISGWIAVETEMFGVIRELSQLTDYVMKISLYVSGLTRESEHIPMGEYWDTSSTSNLKVHSYELHSVPRNIEKDIYDHNNNPSTEEEIISTLKQLNSIIESANVDNATDRKLEIEYLRSCCDRLNNIVETGVKIRLFR